MFFFLFLSLYRVFFASLEYCRPKAWIFQIVVFFLNYFVEYLLHLNIGLFNLLHRHPQISKRMIRGFLFLLFGGFLLLLSILAPKPVVFVHMQYPLYVRTASSLYILPGTTPTSRWCFGHRWLCGQLHSVDMVTSSTSGRPVDFLTENSRHGSLR